MQPVFSKTPANNCLYYGDNLSIMAKLLARHNDFIDLIYIDPPFNSKRNYNLLYKDRHSELDSAQIEAFKDTWSNVYYEDNLQQIRYSGLKGVDEYLQFIENTLPPAFVSYLSMMALRIYYCHRLLKDTGSFYLHCDPTMSHYLKTLCDLIFGIPNFRNEIVWCYGGRGMAKKWWNKKHDLLLFYTKTQIYQFNHLAARRPLDERYTGRYNKVDEKGKKYALIKNKNGSYSKIFMKEEGVVYEDYWQMPYVRGNEALGYPTQKPLALLERIIKASSNPGDMVADFFCGCGTSLDAAIGLKRKFIGVDISTLSIALIENRLKREHALVKDKDYEVHGLPTNLEQAQKLADTDKLEFQDWVVSYLVQGLTNPKKTADRGIDGWLYFKHPQFMNKDQLCLLEVKGGKNLSMTQVRAFIQVCNKHKDGVGLMLTMGNITDGMRQECYSQGKLFETFAKCEIMSIADLLVGKKTTVFNYSTTHHVSFENVKSAYKKMDRLI